MKTTFAIPKKHKLTPVKIILAKNTPSVLFSTAATMNGKIGIIPKQRKAKKVTNAFLSGYFQALDQERRLFLMTS